MKLKRLFLKVSNDGPEFTDYKGKWSLTTYDIILRTGKDVVTKRMTIPVYLDVDEFPDRKR